MTDLFLCTKLYIPPSRPDLIRRERLLAYLDEGIAFGRKVIAGLGSCRLWQDGSGQRVGALSCGYLSPCRYAWVTPDKGDNRLPHFIAYLVAAFQKIYADLGQELLPALQLPQSPPVAVVLTELINQLAARSSGDPHEHYLLALDDHQEITEAAVNEAVTFLQEQSQVQWALGNRDGAAVALQEAAQVVAQRVIVPPESTLLVTHRVRLWLRQADWSAVEQS